MSEEQGIRKVIFDVIEDAVSDFFYYNRKEDEELSVGDLSDALETGTITIDEIVMAFKDSIESNYKSEPL